MAKSGDVIENPLTGEKFLVAKSSAETNGKSLEGVFVFSPKTRGPREHIHPIIEERVKVLAGIIKVRIDGAEHTLREGEELLVKPGSSHAVWNDTEEEARFNAHVQPALQMETFIETAFGLARDGKTNKQGMPNLLQGAVLLQAYSDEMRVSGVAVFAQRLLGAVLAPVGKLFGYRARYPEYSDD